MINWNEPLECKVWGCKHEALNHDWQPVRKVEANHHGTYDVYDDETPFYFDWVLLNGEIINRQNGKQIGLVRNKKVEVIRDVGKITGVTFYGGVASIKYEVVRNGVIHRAFDAPHNKHDIVIYYEDLGDKVKITDWEGIMSYQDVHDMGIIAEYIKTDERIYGYSNYCDTWSNINGHNAFQKGTVMPWEEFDKLLQHIKKAAENLHNIRKEQKEHKVKKMKAII